MPGSDHHAVLEALREHLAELQLSQIVHGRRAIILFEGPGGAGKRHALRQLASAFDPCHYSVYCSGWDRREASEGHWLARFWRRLPSAGSTAIFYRSWYRRVLDDRVLGRTPEDSIVRVYDEINEFEAQQRDYGTLILKLYFDVAPAVQQRRLAERARHPWWREVQRDEPVGVEDPRYARALRDLRQYSDTRWSPWHVIDGSDEPSAAVAVLETVADAWSKAMPADPPNMETPPILA